MKLDQADIDNFPKFAQYVKRSMPTVTNVGTIVKNMKKHGSLTKEQLQLALVWGAGPKVVIKSLSNFECGVQEAYGCFVHANPGQIEIDLATVETFESDAHGGGVDNNASGQAVFIVGATLLHELCHWGNFKAGRAETTEQGMAYERATYGRVIG